MEFAQGGNMPKTKKNNFDNVSKELNKFIAEVNDQSEISQLILRQGLNEAWFSEMLSWLLDVKGSHGFGVRFAQEFLKYIARIRTGEGGKHNKNSNYSHRKKFLKWEKTAIAGTPSTQFSLKNSAVFTEYYLSKQNSKYGKNKGIYCDLVFLDLDSSDGLFVCIENKLFTTNHKFQLETYHEIVEEKYKRAKVIEYVYLTLNGEPPILGPSASQRICNKVWIRMSWVDHILEILEALKSENGWTPRNNYARKQLDEFIKLLRWLNLILHPKNIQVYDLTKKLFRCLVEGASKCLFEELKRLNEGARGEWREKQGKSKSKLIHSSKPKTPLFIGVLPNLSIAVYSEKNNKQQYDKLLIPFGSNPDQIYNLMDIAARDLYSLHFGKNYKLYLGNSRRQTATVSENRKAFRDLFDFIYRNKLELQVLFTLARREGFKDIVDNP
ncbi:MAG: PD-(D/E)XK nuclease family protein [Bacteroidota bacterium]